GWPPISASIAARPVMSATSPKTRTLRSLGGMRVEELLMHHRVERLEVALDHRVEAFVLKVEDLLLAHCQISFAVLHHGSTSEPFIQSDNMKWRFAGQR